jgi:hypothetical protein
MPLHYTKLFAIIALITIAAFILWQIWVGFFAGDTVEQPEPAAFHHAIPDLSAPA